VRVVSLLSFRGVSILDHQFIYLIQLGPSKFALYPFNSFRIY